MKPVDRLGSSERAVVVARTSGTLDVRLPLRHFRGPLEVTLRALLDVLLPGVPSNIDLVAFVDANADKALGRGDRRPGVAQTPQLFIDGLAALTDLAFASLPKKMQHELVAAFRDGRRVAGLDRHTGKEFVDRLLEKALAGYLSHPDTWQRIGFGGPAYPDGYAWIGLKEASARRARAAGWDRL